MFSSFQETAHRGQAIHDTGLTMAQEVGELSETRGEVSVEWRIDNIQLQENEGDKEYTSSVFPLSDACWCLGIIISNCQGSKTMYVFLRREDWGPSKSVTYQLGYRDSEGYENSLCNERIRVFPKNNASSARLHLSCSNPSAIICTVKSGEKHPLDVSLFRRLWDTSLSQKNILVGRKGTDVVLKLRNKETRVHRMIMESRFPDFARKLDKEMKESRAGVLSVRRDEEDAFDIAFSYVYSGEPEGLSSENVCSVYRIALKYDLRKLKKLCTVFLEKNLSVAGVCDVIAWADFYGEVLLKERAKEFFAENASEILKTEKWRSFKREKSSLFLELLECMMKGNA